MANVSIDKVDTKGILIDRITPIVQHFLTTDDLFEGLNQTETVEVMVDVLMRNYSPAELEIITQESLTRKIRRLLGIEVLAHLFDDLTPEQIAGYDAVIQDMRKNR